MTRQLSLDLGPSEPGFTRRAYFRVQVRLGGNSWQYILSEPGASECATHWEAQGAEVEKTDVPPSKVLDGSER